MEFDRIKHLACQRNQPCSRDFVQRQVIGQYPASPHNRADSADQEARGQPSPPGWSKIVPWYDSFSSELTPATGGIGKFATTMGSESDAGFRSGSTDPIDRNPVNPDVSQAFEAKLPR